jgi:hypothetical protein
MLDLIQVVGLNVGRSLFQIVTGKLFTDAQVSAISTHAVGKLFADWMPEPKAEREAKTRAEKAQNHIAEATRIVSNLKAELDQQTKSLEALAEEVEEKRRKAEEYATLAKADAPIVEAMKAQMVEAVRKELKAQAAQGKRWRQAVGFTIWLMTLIGGAALGSHWPAIEASAREVLSLDVHIETSAQTPNTGAAPDVNRALRSRRR